MPNWAFGIVEVSGTKTEIESFIGRFISDDDPPTIAGKRYFARSFLNEERQTCIDEAMKTCECFADDALVRAPFRSNLHGRHTPAWLKVIRSIMRRRA